MLSFVQKGLAAQQQMQTIGKYNHIARSSNFSSSKNFSTSVSHVSISSLFLLAFIINVSSVDQYILLNDLPLPLYSNRYMVLQLYYPS